MTPIQDLLEHCRSATEKLASFDPKVNPTFSALSECEPASIELLQRQASLVLVLGSCYHEATAAISTHAAAADAGVDEPLLAKRLDDLIALTNRQFYSVPPREVKVGWREMYAAAHAVKFHFKLLQSSLAGGGEHEGHREGGEVDALVAVLDYGLIVSGGPGEIVGRAWVNRALELLEDAWREHLDNRNGVDARQIRWPRISSAVPNATTGERPTPPPPPTTNRDGKIMATRPVERLADMEIYEFEEHMRRRGTPLVLTDLTRDWPALTTRPWKSVEYLLSRTFGGRRLVPVEVGRSYLDDGWGQEVIPFKEFIARWMGEGQGGGRGKKGGESDAAVGYLAQHNLFSQIPALAQDIATPDLCFADPPLPPTPLPLLPKLDLPLRNAWFGPAGTITPLHTDPYHNLLCQVVGEKYVRLYAPDKGGFMRTCGVRDGVNMGNTAGVDVGVVEGWDQKEGDEGRDRSDGARRQVSAGRMSEQDKRRFREIEYVDCVLGPGDVLYIPEGWWHYCRGLALSFSVSFWWN